MRGGHSEACAADLAAVVSGRGLGRGDAAWLARVVAGAVRPNRDKPWWDLAHAMAALPGRDAAAALDLALDPRLAEPGALARRVSALEPSPGAAVDARGLVLEGAEGRPWRTAWGGLARLLALLEFTATADECARFAEVVALMAGLREAGPGRIPVAEAVRRLSRWAAEHRAAHIALAPVERRFRAILAFLSARGREGLAFTDDDILEWWEREAAAGDTALFATAVEHFATCEKAAAELGSRLAIAEPAALDAIENWEERLQAIALPALEPEGPLLDALAAIPDAPKILTARERERLGGILRLDPFHRARPRTALRALAFGRAQSGIANRLRRGSGGAEVAERARCEDAEGYDAIRARGEVLAGHLRRLLRVALALRADGVEGEREDLALAVREGEGELRRIRRAGFERPREEIAAVFASADGGLARLLGEVDAFVEAVAALARRAPLPDAFERDRDRFAAAFAALYATGEDRHA